MFVAVYGATPWDMPPDVALGLMANLGTANAWKTVPVLQGIGLSVGSVGQRAAFLPTLFGGKPSVQAQIRSSFDQMRDIKWQSM